MNVLALWVLLYATIKCGQSTFSCLLYSLCFLQVPALHNLYIYLMMTIIDLILVRFTLHWLFTVDDLATNKIQWNLKNLNGSRFLNRAETSKKYYKMSVYLGSIFRQRNILINNALFHMNNLKEMLIWQVKCSQCGWYRM